MAILALNGLPLRVAVGSLSHSIEQVGESKRAENGSLILDRRATKRVFEFSTPPRPLEETLFLRDVALGRGDVWALDANLYSSKGRPVSYSDATHSSTRSKWGTKSLLVAAAESVQFPSTSSPIDVSLGATIVAWAWYATPAVWLLDVLSFTAPGSSDWSASVTTAGVVTTPSGTDSDWALSGSGYVEHVASQNVYFSDVWLIPRSLAGIDATTLSDWASRLATVTGARAPSPRLYLTGDWIDPGVNGGVSPRALVTGEATGLASAPVRRDGVWAPLEHTLSLRLTEV